VQISFPDIEIETAQQLSLLLRTMVQHLVVLTRILKEIAVEILSQDSNGGCRRDSDLKLRLYCQSPSA